MRLRYGLLVTFATASPLACSSPPGGVIVGPADAGPDAIVVTDAASPSDASASPDSPIATDAASTPDAAPAPDAAPSDACPAPAPPPSGFALLDPGVDQGNQTADRGMRTALAVDADGSPLIAYERVVAAQDGGAKTSEVWFTRWDRSCGGAWVAPVRVDGVEALTDNTRGVDIAYDASTGSTGIAYRAHSTASSPANTYEIRVATLAKGASAFTIETVFGFNMADPNVPAGPNSAAIAMANGAVWVAATAGFVGSNCTSNCDGVLWTKKTGTTWDALSRIVAPFIQFYGVSLEVDSAGSPAIAYGHGNQAGTASALTYQRLGGAPVDVITGISTDAVAELAFDGTKPRIVGKMHQSDWATSGRELWFASSDDGATWSSAVNVPNDQGDVFDLYPAIAIGPAGKVAVGAAINQSNGTRSFGTPKYSTSADLKTFATTGPALIPSSGIDFAQWMRAAYGEGGKLQVAFYLSVPTSPYLTGQGLVFWRE